MNRESTPSAIHSGQTSWIRISPLLLVLCWSLLYLPHLRVSPTWYGDETLTLVVGKSLFEGVGANQSLFATFWHPSYAYQPGYAWLAGWASSLTGGDILGARFLNAILALAIALAVFFGGRRPFGVKLALFGSLMFLTYSQTVIHFRWVYPHNAVALGFAIAVLCLLRASSWKSDWTAGAGLAIAALAHPLFVHGALASWLCRMKRPVAWVRMAALPALAVIGCIGWTLSMQRPNLWLFDDIQLLAEFYGTFSRDNGSGFQIFQNLLVFYTQDFFHAGAFIAAVICCNRRFYVIPLFLAVVSGLLLQNRQNLPVFYYQAVVFLPVMAMAWAGAARTLETRVRQAAGNLRWSRPVLAAVFLLPAFQFLQIIYPAASGHLVPRNQHWCTQSVSEVETAAAWLNERLSENDLVICHQNIGWLLNCRTADLMQATAWSGRSTFAYEKPLDKARFRYPADLHAARYLVLADIDQRWTLGLPNVPWILDEISTKQWRIVWRGENYMIVENPDFLPATR